MVNSRKVKTLQAPVASVRPGPHLGQRGSAARLGNSVDEMYGVDDAFPHDRTGARVHPPPGVDEAVRFAADGRPRQARRSLRRQRLVRR